MARDSSSTPLQALVLLNDPSFVEAAKALAADSEDIADLFRRALTRLPSPAELEVLEELAEAERIRLRDDAEAAKGLLSVGQTTIEADDDDGLGVFPEVELLSTGFEYQLKKAHLFVLKGRHSESLRPVKIKRAWISPANRGTLLSSPEIEVAPAENLKLSLRLSTNEKLTL